MRDATNPDNWRYERRGHQEDDFWTDGVPDWIDDDERTPRTVMTPALSAKHPEKEPALLLKVEDAARLLGVGRTTFFDLIGQGRIQTVRVGRRRLVVRAGLERFVEEISS